MRPSSSLRRLSAADGRRGRSASRWSQHSAPAPHGPRRHRRLLTAAGVVVALLLMHISPAIAEDDGRTQLTTLKVDESQRTFTSALTVEPPADGSSSSTASAWIHVTFTDCIFESDLRIVLPLPSPSDPLSCSNTPPVSGSPPTIALDGEKYFHRIALIRTHVRGALTLMNHAGVQLPFCAELILDDSSFATFTRLVSYVPQGAADVAASSNFTIRGGGATVPEPSIGDLVGPSSPSLLVRSGGLDISGARVFGMDILLRDTELRQGVMLSHSVFVNTSIRCLNVVFPQLQMSALPVLTSVLRSEASTFLASSITIDGAFAAGRHDEDRFTFDRVNFVSSNLTFANAFLGGHAYGRIGAAVAFRDGSRLQPGSRFAFMNVSFGLGSHGDRGFAVGVLFYGDVMWEAEEGPHHDTTSSSSPALPEIHFDNCSWFGMLGAINNFGQSRVEYGVIFLSPPDDAAPPSLLSLSFVRCSTVGLRYQGGSSMLLRVSRPLANASTFLLAFNDDIYHPVDVSHPRNGQVRVSLVGLTRIGGLSINCGGGAADVHMRLRGAVYLDFSLMACHLHGSDLSFDNVDLVSYTDGLSANVRFTSCSFLDSVVSFFGFTATLLSADRSRIWFEGVQLTGCIVILQDFRVGASAHGKGSIAGIRWSASSVLTRCTLRIHNGTFAVATHNQGTGVAAILFDRDTLINETSLCIANVIVFCDVGYLYTATPWQVTSRVGFGQEGVAQGFLFLAARAVTASFSVLWTSIDLIYNRGGPLAISFGSLIRSSVLLSNCNFSHSVDVGNLQNDLVSIVMLPPLTSRGWALNCGNSTFTDVDWRFSGDWVSDFVLRQCHFVSSKLSLHNATLYATSDGRSANILISGSSFTSTEVRLRGINATSRSDNRHRIYLNDVVITAGSHVALEDSSITGFGHGGGLAACVTFAAVTVTQQSMVSLSRCQLAMMTHNGNTRAMGVYFAFATHFANRSSLVVLQTSFTIHRTAAVNIFLDTAPSEVGFDQYGSMTAFFTQPPAHPPVSPPQEDFSSFRSESQFVLSGVVTSLSLYNSALMIIDSALLLEGCRFTNAAVVQFDSDRNANVTLSIVSTSFQAPEEAVSPPTALAISVVVANTGRDVAFVSSTFLAAAAITGTGGVSYAIGFALPQRRNAEADAETGSGDVLASTMSPSDSLSGVPTRRYAWCNQVAAMTAASTVPSVDVADLRALVNAYLTKGLNLTVPFSAENISTTVGVFVFGDPQTRPEDVAPPKGCELARVAAALSECQGTPNGFLATTNASWITVESTSTGSKVAVRLSCPLRARAPSLLPRAPRRRSYVVASDASASSFVAADAFGTMSVHVGRCGLLSDEFASFTATPTTTMPSASPTIPLSRTSELARSLTWSQTKKIRRPTKTATVVDSSRGHDSSSSRAGGGDHPTNTQLTSTWASAEPATTSTVPTDSQISNNNVTTTRLNNGELPEILTRAPGSRDVFPSSRLVLSLATVLGGPLSAPFTTGAASRSSNAFRTLRGLDCLVTVHGDDSEQGATTQADDISYVDAFMPFDGVLLPPMSKAKTSCLFTALLVTLCFGLLLVRVFFFVSRTSDAAAAAVVDSTGDGLPDHRRYHHGDDDAGDKVRKDAPLPDTVVSGGGGKDGGASKWIAVTFLIVHAYYGVNALQNSTLIFAAERMDSSVAVTAVVSHWVILTLWTSGLLRAEGAHLVAAVTAGPAREEEEGQQRRDQQDASRGAGVGFEGESRSAPLLLLTVVHDDEGRVGAPSPSTTGEQKNEHAAEGANRWVMRLRTARVLFDAAPPNELHSRFVRLVVSEEIFVASISAVTAGLLTSRRIPCVAGGVAQLLLALAHAAYLIGFHPYEHRLELALAAVNAGCQVALAGGTLIVMTKWQQHDDAPSSGSLSTMVVALSIFTSITIALFFVQPVCLAAAEGYEWYIQRRRRQRRRWAAPSPALGPPPPRGGNTQMGEASSSSSIHSSDETALCEESSGSTFVLPIVERRVGGDAAYRGGRGRRGDERATSHHEMEEIANVMVKVANPLGTTRRPSSSI